MNMEEEIKKLQNKTEELETYIEHLKADVSDKADTIDNLGDEIHSLNTMIEQLLSDIETVGNIRGHIRDVMEEVAKLAKEPVGMMFDYSRV